MSSPPTDPLVGTTIGQCYRFVVALDDGTQQSFDATLPE